MIHRFSRRASQPFVPVDCSSIAPSLLESELFGAMRGAFTATNRDLQRLVDEKKFREDLWYRLNTVRIVLPPLRERAATFRCWPSNVRQLQHVIERKTLYRKLERMKL
jgi:transcriptional regulator with GAF, ATPase, and Fis domain